MRTLALPVPGLVARICELPLSDEVRAAYAEWLPVRWQNAVEKRKSQSIGARWCAAVAAEELGMKLSEVLLDEAGMPLWPAGVVGSLAHSDNQAVAVLSRTHRNLGVDVEDLFDEKKIELLRDTILTEREKNNLSTDLREQCWQMTSIFALKEAAYKALYPELRSFIDFPQLDVDLTRLEITHESGKVLRGLVLRETSYVISITYL